MDIIFMFLSWTGIALVFSLLFDDEVWKVRFRFVYMMVACSIVTYFLFAR